MVCFRYVGDESREAAFGGFEPPVVFAPTLAVPIAFAALQTGRSFGKRARLIKTLLVAKSS